MNLWLSATCIVQWTVIGHRWAWYFFIFLLTHPGRPESFAAQVHLTNSERNLKKSWNSISRPSRFEPGTSKHIWIHLLMYYTMLDNLINIQFLYQVFITKNLCCPSPLGCPSPMAWRAVLWTGPEHPFDFLDLTLYHHTRGIWYNNHMYGNFSMIFNFNHTVRAVGLGSFITITRLSFSIVFQYNTNVALII